jgi:DNA helicase-2/ATP-dependent DNA helicase PcrA
MLAYARLLLNPADDVSCARIINTPTRGIGATTIKRLGDYAMKNNLSLLAAARAVEASHLPAAAQKRVRAFADLIDSLAAEIGRPVRMVLEDIFHRSGLEEALSSADEEARQARANIEELITSAAEFDHDHEDATLEDYLQQISLVSDIDHFEGDEGSVTLMTLHAAKGLEFPAVFIVGCEEGLLPFQREAALPGEGEDIQALEEERRLAFVGMTRAKEKLTLSSARSRMVRGRRMPQAASRFLHEMGEDDARQIDLTTGKHDIGRRRRKSRGGFYDASEREAIEEFAGSYDPFEHYEVEQEPIPPEYEYLRPGCMVRHPKFGVGKLLKLSQPWPDTRAEVHFHQFGKKKLVLAMSKLEMAE